MSGLGGVEYQHGSDMTDEMTRNIDDEIDDEIGMSLTALRTTLEDVELSTPDPIKDMFILSIQHRFYANYQGDKTDSPLVKNNIITNTSTTETPKRTLDPSIGDALFGLFTYIELNNALYTRAKKVHSCYSAYRSPGPRLTEAQKQRIQDALDNAMKARGEFWYRQLVTLFDNSDQNAEKVVECCTFRTHVVQGETTRERSTPTFDRPIVHTIHQGLVRQEIAYDDFLQINTLLQINDRKTLSPFWKAVFAGPNTPRDIMDFCVGWQEIETKPFPFDRLLYLIQEEHRLSRILQSKRRRGTALRVDYVMQLVEHDLSWDMFDSLYTPWKNDNKQQKKFCTLRNLQSWDTLYKDIPLETDYILRTSYEGVQQNISDTVYKLPIGPFFEQFALFRGVWGDPPKEEDYQRLIKTYTNSKKTIDFPALTLLYKTLNQRGVEDHIIWETMIQIAPFSISPSTIARTLDACPALPYQEIVDLLSQGFTLELLAKLVEQRPNISQDQAYRMFKAAQTHVEKSGVPEGYRQESGIQRAITPFRVMSRLAEWGSLLGKDAFTFESALDLLANNNAITSTIILNTVFEKIDKENLLQLITDPKTTPEVIALIAYGLTGPDISGKQEALFEKFRDFNCRSLLSVDLSDVSSVDNKGRYHTAVLICSTLTYQNVIEVKPDILKQIIDLLVSNGHIAPVDGTGTKILGWLQDQTFLGRFGADLGTLPLCEIIGTALACEYNQDRQKQLDDTRTKFFGAWRSREKVANGYHGEQDEDGTWTSLDRIPHTYEELYGLLENTPQAEDDEAKKLIHTHFGVIAQDIERIEKLEDELRFDDGAVFDETFRARKALLAKPMLADDMKVALINAEQEGLSFNLFEPTIFSDTAIQKTARARKVGILSPSRSGYDELPWLVNEGGKLYDDKVMTCISSHGSYGGSIVVSPYRAVDPYTLTKVWKEAVVKKLNNTSSGIIETIQCSGSELAERHVDAWVKMGDLTPQPPMSFLTYTANGKLVHKIATNARTRFFQYMGMEEQLRQPFTVRDYLQYVGPGVFGIPVIAEEHSNDLTGFIVTPEHAQDVYDRNIALTDELERLKRDLERCMTMSKPDLGGLGYDQWMLPYRAYFAEMMKTVDALLEERSYTPYVVTRVF